MPIGLPADAELVVATSSPAQAEIFAPPLSIVVVDTQLLSGSSFAFGAISRNTAVCFNDDDDATDMAELGHVGPGRCSDGHRAQAGDGGGIFEWPDTQFVCFYDGYGARAGPRGEHGGGDAGDASHKYCGGRSPRTDGGSASGACAIEGAVQPQWTVAQQQLLEQFDFLEQFELLLRGGEERRSHDEQTSVSNGEGAKVHLTSPSQGYGTGAVEGALEAARH